MKTITEKETTKHKQSTAKRKEKRVDRKAKETFNGSNDDPLYPEKKNTHTHTRTQNREVKERRKKKTVKKKRKGRNRIQNMQKRAFTAFTTQMVHSFLNAQKAQQDTLRR